MMEVPVKIVWNFSWVLGGETRLNQKIKSEKLCLKSSDYVEANISEFKWVTNCMLLKLEKQFQINAPRQHCGMPCTQVKISRAAMKLLKSCKTRKTTKGKKK